MCKGGHSETSSVSRSHQELIKGIPGHVIPTADYRNTLHRTVNAEIIRKDLIRSRPSRVLIERSAGG